MAISITIDNLSNGQQISLPYEVTGSATTTNAQINAMAAQLDDLMLTPLQHPSFSLELTETVCGPPGAWHILRIYAWDNVGDCGTKAVTFLTV
jgi:hypothetical protein